MEMLSLPSGGGISAFMEWHRQFFPEGHEFVGFEEEGRIFTLEDIKALEGRENKMDPKIQGQVPGVIRQILGEQKQRAVKHAFFYNDSYIAFADDDTAWILIRDSRGDYWRQLRNAGVPNLPQEGAF